MGLIHQVTSQLIYDQIQRNGLLSAMRFRVYDKLFHNPRSTAGEITQMLRVPQQPHPSYHRRLDELGDLGERGL